MIVYVITHRQSGKQYVGQTNDGFDDRWRSHLKDANRRASCRVFHAALRKYGPEAFDHDWVELPSGSTQEDLDALEVRTIAALKTQVPNGYNLRAGGAGGQLHAQSKRRIACAQRAVWSTAEYRQRMSVAISAAQRGRKKSRRHVAAVTAALRGKSKSPEHVEKMRQAARARMADPARRRHLSEIAKARFADPAARQQAAETQKGKRHGETAKAKISAANKARGSGALLNSPEAIAARRANRKPCTAETRARLAEMARNVSEETRAKMRDAARRRPAVSEKTRELHRRRMLDLWAARRNQSDLEMA